METITIPKFEFESLMKELNLLKQQNFQIIDEIEEMKNFRKIRTNFSNEVLTRKENDNEWLSEKESDDFYENMKSKIENV